MCCPILPSVLFISCLFYSFESDLYEVLTHVVETKPVYVTTKIITLNI